MLPIPFRRRRKFSSSCSSPGFDRCRSAEESFTSSKTTISALRRAAAMTNMIRMIRPIRVRVATPSVKSSRLERPWLRQRQWPQRSLPRTMRPFNLRVAMGTSEFEGFLFRSAGLRLVFSEWLFENETFAMPSLAALHPNAFLFLCCCH